MHPGEGLASPPGAARLARRLGDLHRTLFVELQRRADLAVARRCGTLAGRPAMFKLPPPACAVDP